MSFLKGICSLILKTLKDLSHHKEGDSVHNSSAVGGLTSKHVLGRALKSGYHFSSTTSELTSSTIGPIISDILNTFLQGQRLVGARERAQVIYSDFTGGRTFNQTILY